MNKRSIGKLRPANRTKEKSPNLTGKLALQRSTLNELVTQLREDGGTEITCNVAGSFNVDPAVQSRYRLCSEEPLGRLALRNFSMRMAVSGTDVAHRVVR